MSHASVLPIAFVALSFAQQGCAGASSARPSDTARPSPPTTVQVEATSDAPPVAEEVGSDAERSEEPLAAITVDPSGLELEDLVVGTGSEAVEGSEAEVHYVGSLLDGSVFDASRARSTPFSFKVGSHAVIAGFEQGVLGMRVGGVRRITIPPELGYGERGSPPTIPPGSVLVFELELLDVR
jgi:FKBP-type peptidyl-prolyl cis-trans isomerase